MKNKEIAPILFRRLGSLCSVLLAWKLMFFLEFYLLGSYHHAAVQQGYPQSMAGREKKIPSFSPCALWPARVLFLILWPKRQFLCRFLQLSSSATRAAQSQRQEIQEQGKPWKFTPMWVTSLTSLPISLLLFTFQNSQVVAFSILFSFLLWSVGELGSSDLTESWLALDVSSF